jgi:serine/threonine protein kinase
MGDKIHRNSLQPGYNLHWYHVERVLGQGGFGITYLATDRNLDQQVAIKEYLPIELAVRDHDSRVYPVTEDHGGRFDWGLERFIAEARTLAKFRHPNIVRVRSVFEENNTAYMVMDFEAGENLQDLLNRRRTLEEVEIRKFLLPVLGGLEAVHAAGFIHRDIKPANLLLRNDESPVLLDFGSARKALGERSRSLTSVVTPGYSPFEQYRSKSGRQGPWTDIYGLGATIYRCIAGVAPMDAIDRSDAFLKLSRDTFVSAVEVGHGRYSRRFLRAVDHAMAFNEQDRPQTIAAWREEFEIIDDEAATVVADRGLPTEFGDPATRDNVFDETAITEVVPEVQTRHRPTPAPVADIAKPPRPIAASQPESPATKRRPPPVAEEADPPPAKVHALRPILIGLLVAMLLIAGALWWRNVYRPPAVEKLTEQADPAVATTPLVAEPEISAPLDDRQLKADAYLDRARAALSEGDFVTADDFIDQALRVADDATAALEMRREVRRLREEAAQLRQAQPADETKLPQAAPVGRASAPELTAAMAGSALEADAELSSPHPEIAPSPDPAGVLLTRAAEQFEALKLSSPPGDNALESYQQVLDLDPDNASARQGLQAIVGRYVALAETRIGREQFGQAENYLQRAAQIDADDQRVSAMRETLVAARRQAEQQEAERLEQEQQRLDQARAEAERQRAEQTRREAEAQARAEAPAIISAGEASQPREQVALGEPPSVAPARIAVRLQGFTNEYDRYGLNGSAIAERVTAKLRAAGWEIVSLEQAARAGDIPMVDVIFHANLNTATLQYSYAASVKFKPTVDTKVREPGTKATPLWSDGRTGWSGAMDLRRINGYLDEMFLAMPAK